MSEIKKSRRGVYYDLTISPYEFITPYGEVFKFSSAKKLEIYTRDISKEVQKLENAVQRNNLYCYIPDEINQLLFKAVYKAFYCKIEG